MSSLVLYLFRKKLIWVPDPYVTTATRDLSSDISSFGIRVLSPSVNVSKFSFPTLPDESNRKAISASKQSNGNKNIRISH